MNNSVNFGDGVFDAAKASVNNRANGLTKIAIDIVFDYLECKIVNLPESIKQLCNNPETEREIVTLWSENLFKEGLVPKGYNGLPDSLVISNLHQEGYLDGLYIGYILAMMAMADNDASEDTILSTRDQIRPNLMGHHYDNRNEFIDRYKDAKYRWIEKAKGAN